MYSESAKLYDLIYGSFKDYDKESADVARLLSQAHPNARTVLDVACGTGEHARILTQTHGLLVDGIDLEPGFIEIARQKLSSAEFIVADMADFQLDRRYDCILCLFSSIGYLRTLDKVTAALNCFRRHLAPGGVAIIEPWFAPGELEDGHKSRHVGEANGVRVERASRTEIEGRLSRLLFDYTIQDASGTRQTSETHELGLFTPAELMDCFESSGLRAEHDPQGLIGRGLYIARASARS